MRPTLLVLAAGMGSRYGGLKQIDPIGPGGEIIIDYSIYDALRAGFGKVVFVIRKEIEDDFKNCACLSGNYRFTHLLSFFSGKFNNFRASSTVATSRPAKCAI